MQDKDKVRKLEETLASLYRKQKEPIIAPESWQQNVMDAVAGIRLTAVRDPLPLMWRFSAVTALASVVMTAVYLSSGSIHNAAGWLDIPVDAVYSLSLQLLGF